MSAWQSHFDTAFSRRLRLYLRGKTKRLTPEIFRGEAINAPRFHPAYGKICRRLWSL